MGLDNILPVHAGILACSCADLVYAVATFMSSCVQQHCYVCQILFWCRHLLPLAFVVSHPLFCNDPWALSRQGEKKMAHLNLLSTILFSACWPWWISALISSYWKKSSSDEGCKMYQPIGIKKRTYEEGKYYVHLIK